MVVSSCSTRWQHATQDIHSCHAGWPTPCRPQAAALAKRAARGSHGTTQRCPALLGERLHAHRASAPPEPPRLGSFCHNRRTLSTCWTWCRSGLWPALPDVG